VCFYREVGHFFEYPWRPPNVILLLSIKDRIEYYVILEGPWKVVRIKGGSFGRLH
jgi:hypothetical protein